MAVSTFGGGGLTLDKSTEIEAMKMTIRNLKSLDRRALFFTAACLALLAFGLVTRGMTAQLLTTLDLAGAQMQPWAASQ